MYALIYIYIVKQLPHQVSEHHHLTYHFFFVKSAMACHLTPVIKRQEISVFEDVEKNGCYQKIIDKYL